LIGLARNDISLLVIVNINFLILNLESIFIYIKIDIIFKVKNYLLYLLLTVNKKIK